MSTRTLPRPLLPLAPDRLLELYRLLVLARRLDAEATALQRQGELAVYPPLEGQEAAQVGSAFALGPQDMAFPSYREFGVALVRGVDPADYLHFFRATWHGGLWDPRRTGLAPVSVPVASQALHAVGWALGARLEGADACAVAYLGDGATSEGDFHEACNLAGVFRAPVVFFCQNNQWAISVPVARQTAAPIHCKAQAYGFPGVRVDGNDVLEVYAAVAEALARARADGTPTLIEAVTYRLGPHSTADDPTLYRSPEEVERWRGQDPLRRYRDLLRGAGVLDAEAERRAEEAAEASARDLRERLVGAPPRDPEDLFRWVYAQPPPDLGRQREELLEEVRGA